MKNMVQLISAYKLIEFFQQPEGKLNWELHWEKKLIPFYVHQLNVFQIILTYNHQIVKVPDIYWSPTIK